MPHWQRGQSTASAEGRRTGEMIFGVALVAGAAGAVIGFCIGGPPGAAAGFIVGFVVGGIILPVGAAAGAAVYDKYEEYRKLKRIEAAANEAAERSRQQADRLRQATLELEEACLRRAQEILSEDAQRKINNIYDSIKMAKRMAERQGFAFDEEAAKQSIKEDYGVNVCFLEELQDAKMSEQPKGMQEALNLASIPQHLISKRRLPDDKGTVTEPISVEEITVSSEANANEKVTFLKAPAGDIPPK